MILTGLDGSQVEFVKLPKGRDSHSHVHSTIHGCVVLEGTLVDIALPRRETVIERGDFRLSAAGAPHRIVVPDAGVHCVVFEIPWNADDSLDERLLRTPKLVTRLREIRSGISADASPARRILTVSELLSAVRNSAADGDLCEPPDWASETADLLSNDTRAPIDGLAKMAGVHRATLSAVFRRAFGVPARTFRSLQRLDHAAILLMRGASPSAAAIEAGFFDQAHMNRAWRHLLGGTPGAWARARCDKCTRQDLSRFV